MQIAPLMSLGGNMTTEEIQPLVVKGYNDDEVKTIDPLSAVVVEKSHYEALLADIALMQQRLEHAESVHREFRTTVRETAILVAEEMNWCRPGLNETLLNLGLDPVTNKYRVTIRVYAYQDVEVEVEAHSEEEADRIAMQDDNMERLWSNEIQEGQWDSDTLSVEDPQVRQTVKLD